MRAPYRLFACLGTFFLLHLVFLGFRSFLEAPSLFEGPEVVDTDTPMQGAPYNPAPNTNIASTVTSKLCQYNDCLKGRWIPRDTPYESLQDLQADYGMWTKCPMYDPEPGATWTEEEETRLGAERLIKMMNWVWKPSSGHYVPWDAEDFVVRLLKTPAGIIIMGDSISAGHEHGFGQFLQQSGIKFDMIKGYVNGVHEQGVRPHVLRAKDPMTLKLQKRAGVPDSRLQYPIFQIIEDHMLIHEPDIRAITEKHGAQKGFRWFLDLKRVEGWEDYLANLTHPRAGEEDSVTEDSILVLNTGAHWSRGTLHMLPHQATVGLEQNTLTKVYKDMQRLIIERISPLKQVKVIYRGTNAAHPGCWEKEGPYPDYLTAFQKEWNLVDNVVAFAKNDRERTTHLRWDWDMFNAHNQAWRREVTRMQQAREELQARDPNAVLPPKWLFMDVWEMSLQRPDAHSDCLHWCLPTVYSDWSRHIYHMMHLEEGK